MLLWIIGIFIIFWAIEFFYLRGENIDAFDQPAGQSFATGAAPNSEHKQIENLLKENFGSVQKISRRERLGKMREYMDDMWADHEFVSTFTEIGIDGLKAEWVVAPGADSLNRVLYLHGGAFMLGSPKSHRLLTSKFSQMANAAVLAIDYRLMPEHTRLNGIEDCRNAYRWILENGPEGQQPASKLFVAGDSAGGNLTLALIAWVRDQGLRTPDAAVALSPATDSTIGSPSFKNNMETDALLGPALSFMKKIPRSLICWVSLLQNRVSPSNPIVSPVFGDLSNLPPILVHASETEMLFDDARRYVNRAVAAGSPVKLQSWAHVPHVWHMINESVTEAPEAFKEIEGFLKNPRAFVTDNKAVHPMAAFTT